MGRIPNAITLSRPVFTFLFCMYIMQGALYRALAVFAVICLSDYLDGKIARALGTSTRLGASLDIGADLIYVLSSLLVLNIRGLAPVWFTVITVLKFLEFTVTSAMLRKHCQCKGFWVFDIVGRYCGMLLFLSPGVLCTAGILPDAPLLIRTAWFALCCAFATVSASARILQSLGHGALRKTATVIPQSYGTVGR